MNYKVGILVQIGMFTVACSAYAESFCFAQAETFYEQVYCEIQANGEGQALPPLYEFQRSPTMTQYLLLKRPAERIGTLLKRPQASRSTTPGAVPGSAASPASDIAATIPPTPSPLSPSPKVSATAPVTGSINGRIPGCDLGENGLNCGGSIYSLVGNRANSRLQPGALEADNHMTMPRFQGDDLQGYLQRSYAHYLEKMMTIGLGGSTMTLAKFEHLYHSMDGMGVDFSQRMEILYEYLKKDKLRIGVSEAVSMPALELSRCESVSSRVISCPMGPRNYVFVKNG